MRYKVGQKLYSAHYYDDNDELYINEHIVRTIRGGMVYAIQKSILTWGKLSRRHGDFGWLKDIPAVCRDRCREGDKMTFLHATKRAAWVELLKYNRDFDDKVVARIKVRIKKCTSR